MKTKYYLVFIMLFISSFIMACPVCERNQPMLTKGWTHGAGPSSNWDWVIIGLMTLITLVTLFFSIKFLVKPGEKSKKHIKHSILTDQ